MLKNGANADLHIDYPPTSIVHCGYKPDLESTDYHQRYSKRKTTPLINAIIHRCPHTVKTLLDQGASRNFADEEGVTPLMYAAVVVSFEHNNVEHWHAGASTLQGWGTGPAHKFAKAI